MMTADGAEAISKATPGGTVWRAWDYTKHRRWNRLAPGYSRFVTLSKFLLPVAASILVALVVVWPRLQSDENRFRMGFTSLSLGGTEEPNMINPRYVGIDSDGRPFTVTADLARTVLKDGSIVELEFPKADLAFKDGSWLMLSSETGRYHRLSNILDLAGGVNLFHDSGLEFRTAKAQINLPKGLAHGTDPVQGQGPFGDIRSQGFRFLREDRVIHFTGKARLTIYPNSKELTK